MVHQFKNNEFEKVFFDIDKLKSIASFKTTYFLPKLQESLDLCNVIEEELVGDQPNIDSLNKAQSEELALLKNEMGRESFRIKKVQNELIRLKLGATLDDETQFEVDEEMLTNLTISSFDGSVADEVKEYIERWDNFYSIVYSKADTKKEAMKEWQNSQSNGYYNKQRKKYHNENLDDIVRNVYEKNKILRYKNELIQQDEPIFLDPDDTNYIGFRSHFYAAKKYFFGKYYETFWFNIIVIWIMSIMLYPPLYYEHLKKILELSEKFKFKRKPKQPKIKEIPKVVKEVEVDVESEEVKN